MFVVDKMVLEDRLMENDDLPPSQLFDIQLPDGTTKSLSPSAHDAFSVFEDLCLLANSETPHFLKLEFLHKTFALELIESVLTNYHALFRKVNSFWIVRKAVTQFQFRSMKSSSCFSNFISAHFYSRPFQNDQCSHLSCDVRV